MDTGSGVTLKVQGDKKLIDSLVKIEDKEKRIELMASIGAYGVSSTQQRFIDGKAPDGTAWKKSLRAETEGHTLRLHGYLMASFTSSATENTAEWGTPMVYAGIHNFGGVILPKSKKALAFRLFNGAFVMVKKVTMLKRQFMGINAADEKRIGDIGVGYLAGAFK